MVGADHVVGPMPRGGQSVVKAVDEETRVDYVQVRERQPDVERVRVIAVAMRAPQLLFQPLVARPIFEPTGDLHVTDGENALYPVRAKVLEQPRVDLATGQPDLLRAQAEGQDGPSDQCEVIARAPKIGSAEWADWRDKVPLDRLLYRPRERRLIVVVAHDRSVILILAEDAALLKVSALRAADGLATDQVEGFDPPDEAIDDVGVTDSPMALALLDDPA